MKTVSIIIPAHNEASYVGDCLRAVLASDPPANMSVKIIVAANGCSDATSVIAQGFAGHASARGWQLTVLNIPQPGKLNALNRAEAGLTDDIRLYLDADVRVDRELLRQLTAILDREGAAYASGTPTIALPKNPLLRAYTRFWTRLPFVSEGVPGFGLFAVNAAGRARWQEFPDIISDDTFVRLHFAPHERHRAAAGYSWPMIDGLANLICVRRRQDAGVAEVARRYPELSQNAGHHRLRPTGLTGRLMRDPAGFLAYGAISLAVRLPVLRSKERWVRGR